MNPCMRHGRYFQPLFVFNGTFLLMPFVLSTFWESCVGTLRSEQLKFGFQNNENQQSEPCLETGCFS